MIGIAEGEIFVAAEALALGLGAIGWSHGREAWSRRPAGRSIAACGPLATEAAKMMIRIAEGAGKFPNTADAGGASAHRFIAMS